MYLASTNTPASSSFCIGCTLKQPIFKIYGKAPAWTQPSSAHQRQHQKQSRIPSRDAFWEATSRHKGRKHRMAQDTGAESRFSPPGTAWGTVPVSRPACMVRERRGEHESPAHDIRYSRCLDSPVISRSDTVYPVSSFNNNYHSDINCNNTVCPEHFDSYFRYGRKHAAREEKNEAIRHSLTRSN